MAVPELLRKLLTAPGPSGYETLPSQAIWREAASGFATVTSDAMGSSVARVAGHGRTGRCSSCSATSTRSG